MLKHVRPRKALQFDCDLSLVREEGDQMTNGDQIINGDQMINGDQTIDGIFLLQDHDQLHLTLDLQVVEQEMEAPLITQNVSDEDDDDSIVTNPPTMLDEDEELDCATEPAFDRLFLGRRLGEMQEEEGEEEEVIEKEAPRRGSVMEGREGLVAAWVETGGRRGFARNYRILGAETCKGQR